MQFKALCTPLSFVTGKGLLTKTRPAFRRTLLVMKLTTILLLAATLQVAAKSNAQTVTYSAKSVSLEKVISVIKKQTGHVFFYREEDLANLPEISVSFNQTPLEAALQQALKGLPLKYSIQGKIIVITRTSVGIDEKKEETITALPPIDVRGKVVNENGEPVTGASVYVKSDRTKGTTTDANGFFELKGIEDNSILVISAVNIETREFKVAGKSDLGTITAKIKIGEAEEVVVKGINTGYGTVKPERFVGAASVLDSIAYSRRAGMDILGRLDGTVSGVLFDKKGGVPLQIRGISTLGGIAGTSMEPLIIVDNFPYMGNIDALNPNDILDITILKDAAAASIWGTKSGNGVIVITTKRARFNQPFRISVASNVTVQQKPDLFYYPRISSADEISVEEFLFSQGFYDGSIDNTFEWPVLSPVIEILNKQRNGEITASQAQEQINKLKGVDLRNDLNKYVYQRAVTQQHYINLSGGNNIANYTFSVGYNNTLPNIQGAKSSNQYTINSVNTIRPYKNLELELGINFSKNVDKEASFPLSNIYPYAQLADASGNSLAVPMTRRMAYIDTAGNGKLQDWYYRPLDEIRVADNVRNTQFARLNFGVSWRPLNWLKASVRYQYIEQTVKSRNLHIQQSYFTRDLVNSFTQIENNRVTYIIPLGGILDINNASNRSHNVRGQLDFNKNWGINHQLTALIAAEASDNIVNRQDGNRFYGYNEKNASYSTNLDYNSFYPQYGLLFYTNQIPQGNSFDEGVYNRFVSFLGNIAYTFKERYNLYASARRDGANVFGTTTNNKWKPLWSVGGSWDISKESFYKLNWMPYLRIRSSYGYMGNANNTLSGVSTLLYSRTLDRYTQYAFAQIVNPPDPNLKWEEVKTVNVAIDFGLLNNRLSGNFEFFQKRSTDVLSPVPIDPTIGITQAIINASSLKANGFEINLNSINTTGPVKWETHFGLSYAKTIVTKVYDGGFRASDFIGYSLNPSEGNIAFGISSYRWAGLDPVTGDPQGYLNGQVSKDYFSIFNDSIQNQVLNGSAIPLYSGFLLNSISWKNFQLSANITYRLKYYFRKPTIQYNDLFNSWQGHVDYTLRWQKPGDEATTTVPSMIYPADYNRDQFYAGSEVNVLKADNIRLQDVRLQYSLNKNNWKSLPFQHVQLFIYANNLNLILWKANHSNLDPDFSGGISPTVYPTPKTWAAGITLNL